MYARSSAAPEIEEAAKLFNHASRIVAFTGAGISTPSGIPDFRSPESGIWENEDPMTVASIFGFRRDPQAFYRWMRPLAKLMRNAKPNAAHFALWHLEALGKLDSIITQNIDMLHSEAGNSRIYELHGHLREATCVECYKVYPGKEIMDRFIKTGDLPRCDCHRQGVLKPNVILFGEQLPYEALQHAKNAIRRCDLLLIIGSSLEVAPASDLPLLAKRSGAKVVMINLHKTDFDRIADVLIRGDVAEVLPAIVEQVEN
ncbi:NAD-dependent deacylase [Phototrophicus methaneseepsis]|uniref:protein acetyllysine N-acetyltransferase n=1 Tax=Phototrophicus methaneseepsis TaxID=2710758 RepID=A0A7S8E647_9CHLR|nr:NAD-dependent deacylase [Phototrophicus methaneseepsis]QPC80974.1 NAD-dependent deacylase [Phototrophicus methaneseepsis]